MLLRFPFRHYLARPFVARRPVTRRGFTLVEILVATVLILVMMGVVVRIFAEVGANVRNSRTAIEANERLRAVLTRLERDLDGVTAPMTPPLDPAMGLGGVEILEGPSGPVFLPPTVAQYAPTAGGTLTSDSTFGDSDDVLWMTIRSKDEPFVGRYSFKRAPVGAETPDGSDAGGNYKWGTTTIQSHTAEVAWFVRGTTLYRRMLLVMNDPTALPDTDVRSATTIDPLPVTAGFYGLYDLSVRVVGTAYDRDPATAAAGIRIVPNTLGDLTKRENRYGHQPFTFPHEIRNWGFLGLPTLRESSASNWPFPFVGLGGYTDHASHVYTADSLAHVIVPSPSSGTSPLILCENSSSADDRYGYQPVTALGSVPAYAADFFALTLPAGGSFDPWSTPFPFNQVNNISGTLADYAAGTRVAEDIIAINVIGFDIRVYDPMALLLRNNDTGEVLEPGDPGYLTGLNHLGTGAGEFEPIGNGAYVDLNYLAQRADGGGDGVPDWPTYTSPYLTVANLSEFRGPGAPYTLNDPNVRGLRGSDPGSSIPVGATYDTFSTHYEGDGVNQDADGLTDEGRDGFDNAAGAIVTNNPATGLGTNGVDDPTELEAPPPYAMPLRGVQVRIRTFEPASREVREVTVTHSFQQ